MLRYALVRLAQLVPVLLLVSFLAFTLLHLAPGNPARLLAPPAATPAQIHQVEISLGLNRPFIVQYGTWLRSVLDGNLGTSYSNDLPVVHLIGQALPESVQLVVSAVVVAVALGIPLGVLAALHRGGMADRAVRAVSIIGIAVPNFVLALMLVLVFGWWATGVLPFSGYVNIIASPWQGFLHTLLPAVALAAGPIGLIARMTRAGMLEVLHNEYVMVATAFGVPRREVVWRDALPNALLPVLTVVGLLVGFLLSGTVVVETVFGIPGLGSLLVSSFSQRDYPTAIGVVLVMTVTFILVNFLTDLLYGWLNPKIRLSYGSASA